MLQVDLTSPSSGVVYDGNGLHDIGYLSYGTHTEITSSWRGFSDDGSGISSYRVCLGTQPEYDDVVPCVNVGLAIHRTFSLNDNLPNG